MTGPIQCPYCFGRGYKPRARRGVTAGFRATPCPPCNSTGQIEPDAGNYRRALAAHGRRRRPG